jgi:hypothetical protein
VQKLKARFEAAVAAEEEAAAALEAAKRAAAEEHARTADAVEGDVDTEIEATRTRFERKLQAESKVRVAPFSYCALMLCRLADHCCLENRECDDEASVC